MRLRPTHSIAPTGCSSTPMREARSRRWAAGAAAVSALALLSTTMAGPARAEAGDDDVSAPERALMTGLDLTIIRPLAALRAGVGAAILVPASILASPSCLVNLVNGADCRPVFEAPYEVLVGEPADYAFNRKLGDIESE